MLTTRRVDLKDRLSHEMDSSRQLALRKELDGRTYQERIDKLVRCSSPSAQEC